VPRAPTGDTAGTAAGTGAGWRGNTVPAGNGHVPRYAGLERTLGGVRNDIVVFVAEDGRAVHGLGLALCVVRMREGTRGMDILGR